MVYFIFTLTLRSSSSSFTTTDKQVDVWRAFADQIKTIVFNSRSDNKVKSKNNITKQLHSDLIYRGISTINRGYDRDKCPE